VNGVQRGQEARQRLGAAGRRAERSEAWIAARRAHGPRPPALPIFPMLPCLSACASAAPGWSIWRVHCSAPVLKPAAGGRRIRLLDGTTVPKAGKEAKKNNGLWRLHCTLDVPAGRFSFIELTDEKGGGRPGRTSVAKGDILIAGRGFMHPGPLAHILEQGADAVLRTGWKGARWPGGNGKAPGILAALAGAGSAGILDRPIWVARKKAPPLALRLAAFRKPPRAAEASRAKARQAAKRDGYALSGGTLAAAGWVILVASLKTEAFPSNETGELYRARWRIEMAFKRLNLKTAVTR
jgi:IS4 transposase